MSTLGDFFSDRVGQFLPFLMYKSYIYLNIYLLQHRFVLPLPSMVNLFAFITFYQLTGYSQGQRQRGGLVFICVL